MIEGTQLFYSLGIYAYHKYIDVISIVHYNERFLELFQDLDRLEYKLYALLMQF